MLAFEDPLIEKHTFLKIPSIENASISSRFFSYFRSFALEGSNFRTGRFQISCSLSSAWANRRVCVLIRDDRRADVSGAIFAPSYPEFYTRHRESITMLVRYMSPLMWSLRSANETAPVSIARVMFMRSSACVYGCRIERHAFVTMMNYFFPFARMLKIFEGQAADLTFSTVVEDLDRNGCNRILSMGSIGLNLVVSFLVEARFRRKFAAKRVN